MRVPTIYLKDKQAFRKSGGALRFAGKPLDLARDLKKAKTKLLHIVDTDALAGLRNNLDVYDGLTYIINVQVECAPDRAIVTKLLSLGCRVVLPASFDVSGIKEKRLLVAKIPKGYSGGAEGFHDVILEGASDADVMRFHTLGKRVMVSESDYGKLGAGCRKLVWAVISSS